MTQPAIAAVLEIHGWPDNRNYRRKAEEILRRRRKFDAKPFKHQAKTHTMLVASDLVLRPIEAMIDYHELTGSYHLGTEGYVVFQDGDGAWYGAAAGIQGVIWHFEMMETRHGMSLPLDPMRELHACVEAVAPISDSLIDSWRASMEILRRALVYQRPDDAIDILHQARIKDAFEAINPQEQQA